MSRGLRLFKQALVSLWAFRTYAILMMIGLIIGIAALTVIQEIGQGAQSRVKSIMEGMGFGADAFYISSGGGRLGVRRHMKRTLTLTPDDAKAISRLDGVSRVVPHKGVSRSQASAGGKHITTRVVGVTPDYAMVRNWGMAFGRFISWGDEQQRSRVAVLGTTAMRELFGQATPVGRSIRIGGVPFQVVGVLEPRGASGRGHDRDDRILIPLSTASKRLTRDDHLSGMRVNIADASRLEEVTKEINLLLRERHRLGPSMPDDFLIITPEELLHYVTRQSRTMVAMLSFISAISLFVSGIVIMNIMLVAVSERSFEIGVRRAIGARRRDILGQVLMESILVAGAGGICGMLLGLVLSWLANLLLEIPTAFSPAGFLWALSFSVAVGLIFGLVPARKAAALEPVEALR